MFKQFIFSLLIFTCSFLNVNEVSAQQPINVVTTIGQITNAVEIIGGEQVSVKGLMGPGVDPHLYKASESDVRKLADADIIFYGGLYLEAKLEDIFEKMSRTTKTVAISEAVPVESRMGSITYTDQYDPHVWFDIPLWKLAVERIRDSLIEYDPQNANLYTSRAEQYFNEFDQLHTYVTERANELDETQRVLVTAHDAFRYFGRRYGFEVVGLQGISTESEAGTKDVIELAKFIAERKIKAVFVESSIPQRNIKAVQEAVRANGWEVVIGGELFSDAMGDEGTIEGTYLGMVTHNIDTIVDALK